MATTQLHNAVGDGVFIARDAVIAGGWGSITSNSRHFALITIDGVLNLSGAYRRNYVWPIMGPSTHPEHQPLQHASAFGPWAATCRIVAR